MASLPRTLVGTFALLALRFPLQHLPPLVWQDPFRRWHGLADPLVRLEGIGRHAALALRGDRHPMRICDGGERPLRYRPPPSQGEGNVVNAYILIQTEVGKAAQVAKEVAAIKGVTSAEDVTGPYDVIVRAEAKNVDELGKLVVAKIQAVEGITRTLTCPVVHL
jgi:DNA-binding Lrp family transcriptional regulator